MCTNAQAIFIMSYAANGTAAEAEAAALAELATLVSSAQGFESAKLLAVACFCWLLYDHLTTIDQEVCYSAAFSMPSSHY